MTEQVTNDGEVIEAHAPLTLFGTNEPVAVVQRASAVATALASVIKERNLTSRIGNKEHVQVEGWTLLGSMLGVFAEVEWSKPLDNGWEARAVARTLAGQVVGAADAMCTRSESSWSRRDDYAIRSMAQTRAVSKALRMPLGFIMHLAGYSATPLEEMADESAQGEASLPTGGATTRSTASPAHYTNRGQVQQAIASAAREAGLTFQHIEERAAELGIARGEASMNDLLRLLDSITGFDRVLAASGGTEQPPASPPGGVVGAPGPSPAPEPQPKKGRSTAEAIADAEQKAGKGKQEAMKL